MYIQKLKRIVTRHAENLSGTVDTGIGFIDDVMGGISPKDLIVIGGKTGFGKTEFCTQVCGNISKQHRTASFLALEAEEDEIDQRLIFRELADLYFAIPKEKRPPSDWVSYRNFYKGLLTTSLYDLVKQASDNVAMKMDGINIVYPKDMSASGLCEFLEREADQYDLLIVDHLHYLEPEKNEKEYESIIKAIKMIRDRALVAGKPVLLVSHLRKSDRFNKDKFPSIDDLHGSSEISKRATGVILIDRAKPNSFTALGINTHPTIFNVPKYRHGGAPINFFGVHNFEIETQQFSKRYLLMVREGDELELYRGEFPWWAKRAMRV